MAKIDDDKLISVLLKQGLIEPEEAQACIEYQKKHLAQRGKEISLPNTLEKLDILPAAKLDSFIRAIESSSINDSIPVFTSEGKVDKDEEDSPKISRAVLGGMGKSKKFSLRPDLSEGMNYVEIPKEQSSSQAKKPVSIFAVNQEKKLSTEPKAPLKPTKVKEKPKVKEKLQQEEKVKEKPKVQQAEEKNISVATAYILLIFLGFLGIHRYYLKKDRSAILYSMTLGFFFVGVIVDLFLLPFMIIQFHKEDNNESCLDLVDGHIETHDNTPPWSVVQGGMDKFKSFLEFNIQIVLALFIPIILMSICFLMEETWIIFPMAGVMSLLLLNNYYPKTSLALEYIPLFSFTKKTCKQLKSMYFYKKPVPSIFYLFYPLWAPIVFLKHKEKTKEAMLYAGFIATSIFTSGIYFFYQLQSLSIEQAKIFASTQFIYSSIVVLIVTGLLITFITIICRWEIQKKETIAKASTGWGVVISAITILTLSGFLFKNEYCFYHKEKEKLQLRFSSENFRDQLKTICTSYLKYIIKEHPEWSQEKKQSVLPQFLGGLMTAKEVSLFRLRFFKESDLSELTWVETDIRAIIAHDKYSIVHKWEMLNSTFQQKILEEPESLNNALQNFHSMLYDKTVKEKGFIQDLSQKKK